MDRLSRKFRIAVKLADRPAWRIAAEAGVNSNILSRIISGSLRVKRGDPRVVAVARVVGLADEECFVMEGEEE